MTFRQSHDSAAKFAAAKRDEPFVFKVVILTNERVTFEPSCLRVYVSIVDRVAML